MSTVVWSILVGMMQVFEMLNAMQYTIFTHDIPTSMFQRVFLYYEIYYFNYIFNLLHALYFARHAPLRTVIPYYIALASWNRHAIAREFDPRHPGERHSYVTSVFKKVPVLRSFELVSGFRFGLWPSASSFGASHSV